LLKSKWEGISNVIRKGDEKRNSHANQINLETSFFFTWGGLFFYLKKGLFIGGN